jgi:hypothetical protein
MKKASCGFLVIFPAAVAFLLLLHQTVYHEFNPQLKGGGGLFSWFVELKTVLLSQVPINTFTSI